MPPVCERTTFQLVPGAPHLHWSRRRPRAGFARLDAGRGSGAPNRLAREHMLRGRGTPALQEVPGGGRGGLRGPGIDITESEDSDCICLGCRQ